MTQTATNHGADIRPVARTSRVRPWIALAAGAVVFACRLARCPALHRRSTGDRCGAGLWLATGPCRCTPGRSPGGRVTPSSESR